MIWKSLLVTTAVAFSLADNVDCGSKGDTIILDHGSKCRSPTVVKTGGKKGGDIIVIGNRHGNCEPEHSNYHHRTQYISMPYLVRTPVKEKVFVPIKVRQIIRIRELVPYPVQVPVREPLRVAIPVAFSLPPMQQHSVTNHYYPNQHDHHHTRQIIYVTRHYLDNNTNNIIINKHQPGSPHSGAPQGQPVQYAATTTPAPGYTQPGEYKNEISLTSYSSSLNHQVTPSNDQESATAPDDSD